MDFRLKVFVEVAELLSFTKAAKKLQISQPAITKHIQELESMYGVQLFERYKGKISLTRYGEIFLGYAEEILAGYGYLKNEMKLISNNITGKIHIGVCKPVYREALPMIADFMGKFPEIEIVVSIMDTAHIKEVLESGEADVAIMGGQNRELLGSGAFKTVAIGKMIPLLFEGSVVYRIFAELDKLEVFAEFAKYWFSKNQKRAVCNP